MYGTQIIKEANKQTNKQTNKQMDENKMILGKMSK